MQTIQVIADILKDIPVPRMVRVRQVFERKKVDDIPASVAGEVGRAAIAGRIRPGMRVALTCGSRGVASIDVVLRSLVASLKGLGAEPFIIPAMGSHGGATAEGQRQILTNYNVTEEFCGCPILSSMEVVQVATAENGDPVFIDKYASEADGIVPVGRIKPHTDYQYKYESGIMKMITIGLGKQKGAESCHRLGPDHLPTRIEMYANKILDNAKILFGVGVVENAYDELCRIRALTPDEICAEEPKLLKYAYECMAQILFKDIDVLLVDRIGKEISGSGADPNVTGRFATDCVKDGMLRATVAAYLRLTEKTEGNACGVGLCDIVTRKLFDAVDFAKTYPNSITSTLLHPSKIPMIMENDFDAVRLAVYASRCQDRRRARVVRIGTTLELSEIWISEALLPQAEKMANVEILGKPEEMRFDGEGNLF